MKTSLEHLPEKKQHQLLALAELIRKDAEVEMVILFGSFARGDARADPPVAGLNTVWKRSAC